MLLFVDGVTLGDIHWFQTTLKICIQGQGRLHHCINSFKFYLALMGWGVGDLGVTCTLTPLQMFLKVSLPIAIFGKSIQTARAVGVRFCVCTVE